MPKTTRSTLSAPTFPATLKALSAAVLLACAASPASHAAGLGKLTVLSSLGQPLHAEIELTAVGKDEGDDLRARLAPVEAYREASVDFNPALMSLRFAMERRAGKQYVRVTSSQPINEPYMDILVELDGRNARLLREYTFLLDPADLKLGRPAQIGAGAAASRPPATSAPSPAVPATNAASAGAPVSAPAAKRADDKPAVDRYPVKQGDTLTEIAKTVRRENVSLDQMLVALYRGNGSAFIDNNMNRLRAGQILTVPDAGTARAVSDGEAHRIVIAQAADFNSYRSKLAGQVAGAAAERLREGGQTSTGKVTAQVEEPAATAQPLDKLKLSRAGGHGAGQGNAADAEDRLATDKALAEANSRVQELEKNVRDLQSLLALKNRELAQRQQQADAARNPAQAEKADAPPAVAMAKPVAAPAPVAEAAPAASKPGASADSGAASAEGKAVEAAPALKKAAPAAKATPAAEPSFFSELSDNPMLLPGAGALLAALGALAVYRGVRRKKQAQPENTVLPESTLKANSLFGSTGGQSVDTNNSMFNSSFSASASQLDANEVDPVAEADVYIAYGRDVQAEEILKEALRTQPERNAVRLKLLEIYANRKDLRSFEIFASELYGMTKGEGGDWKQAATLGLSIDPENPLYAGDALPEELAAKAEAITAPTQPLEEAALDMPAVTAGEASVASADDAEPGVLHLDLGADLESSPAHPEPEATPNVATSEPSAKEAFDAQLDSLDFDLAGFSGVRTDDEKTDDAANESADADMPTLNFELPMPHGGAVPAATASGELDSGDLDVETAIRDEAPALALAAASPNALTSAESDHDEEEAAPAVHLDMAPAAMDFDLSDIKLDLDAPLSETATVVPADVGASLPLGTNAEMATKLDLAAAYQEIGDHEGARELLEEVMQGGSPQQVEEARGRLEKMA